MRVTPELRNKILGGAGLLVVFAIGVVYIERANEAKVGQPCTEEGSGHCWGPDRRVACIGGKWVDEPCRGDKGCRQESSKKAGFNDVLCDTSGNVAGDACLGEEPMCARGGNGVLSCVEGRLRLDGCPAGCAAGTCRSP